ncbi:MAG TPA: ATP-binding cassette domain-containing protein [Acidimicrobiales bacterium]|nr:ATP-binding cassette domain-containing protein [Acidimicrobiales bacterium]
MSLDVDVSVRRRAAVVNVAFTLESGDRLALFGPSGAGKTTTLEAIAGTVALSDGEVRLDGALVNGPRLRRPSPLRPARTLAPRASGIAFVRQPTSLFPHLSVGDNLAYGQGVKASEVETWLSKADLTGLAGASPGSLSGGQRQRLALARSLARPFRVLLLDEPLSAVDRRARPQLWDLVDEAISSRGAISLLVTHDLHEAQGFGQQMALIDEGRLLQLGEPEKLARAPVSERAAELVGYCAFVARDEATAWAVHPDRVVAGEHPDRGLVLDGVVACVRVAGVSFAYELATTTGDRIDVPVQTPPQVGTQVRVTALDPPLVTRVKR